jgi:hypothetical protein
LLYQTPAEKFAECVAAISWTRHPNGAFGRLAQLANANILLAERIERKAMKGAVWSCL